MPITGTIKTGAYYDSVTLMNVAKKVATLEGVNDAGVVMGTAENKAILRGSGLLIQAFEDAKDTDLLIGLDLTDDASEETVLEAVEAALIASRKNDDSETAEERALSFESAIERLPEANICLISIAGRYAAHEARKALDAGLHVMLFSDNISVEDEVALKKIGAEKGLLVMGPDCGTAIINGVPLAFANVVKRGTIGVVAASGTGLQEVTCVISNEGAGISQAIGTGGRDVKGAVGGIMFMEALKALAADPATKVLLLVSKPPDAAVMKNIQEMLKDIDKPVVSIFLGAKPATENEAFTLDEAALKAVALARDESVADVMEKLAIRQIAIREQAEQMALTIASPRKYVRGLFSGGTFCTEAQLLLGKELNGIYSNAPAGKASKLEDPLQSKEHTLVDLGEDQFTVGRPHPMIDFTLRNKRILQEADDPETAVILLDIVLGYGSNMDPISELTGIIDIAAEKVPVVCSVTGTDHDPQNRSLVTAALRAMGAVVLPTNAAASELAGYIAVQMEK